jgi:hypothetical protein
MGRPPGIPKALIRPYSIKKNLNGNSRFRGFDRFSPDASNRERAESAFRFGNATWESRLSIGVIQIVYKRLAD